MSSQAIATNSGRINDADSRSHRVARDLLARASIKIDGSRPWDMQLKHSGVLERVLVYGGLGLGETYMDGHWDVERLDEFFARLLASRNTANYLPWRFMFNVFVAKLVNPQSPLRSERVGQMHYDIGNDFYAAMLDPRMTYTCGYWRTARDLAQAQEDKLELVCRKLRLQKGMRILDIGCGWGSFMAYAAERYGVEAVGISISREQIAWATNRYRGLPLEFRFQDYRELDERFDAIASIGMFEHVGRLNHRTYMQVAHRCLRKGGLFLLHTIGKNQRKAATDAWISKYIFPGGDLPSVGQIGGAVDDLFVVEDVHNFGADYDRTLMAWWKNFEDAWPRFEERLGERFHRMWRYYLLSCAGAFRARDIQLWQWVLSKDGVPGGYHRET